MYIYVTHNYYLCVNLFLLIYFILISIIENNYKILFEYFYSQQIL